MRSTLILLSVILYCTALQAQQVTGIAKDDQGKPLSGTSVALKKVSDSSLVKINVSDSTGKYEFLNVPAGKYFINVSHVGFLPGNTAAFEVRTEINNTVTPAISLVRLSSNLKEVVVSSSKPIIEVKADKIILNVEGSVNAVGQNALELLRKSPGVMVDKDNNLSLSGKNGVQVFIDGRPTPLAGTDLSEYLKTIQSASIEAIEIISNPSARYEAAGNAGIINIRLKKNKAYGTNGTVNAGYNVGTYSKYNGGLSLNHRDRNINLFGNYNYSHTPFRSHAILRREQLDTLFDNSTVLLNTTNNHNIKAGMDYFINKRSTFGLIASGSFSGNSTNTFSLTPISYIPTGVVDRILNANNRGSGRRDNGNLNANYRYADTSGHEWNVDADYGLYRIRNDQLQPNYYSKPSGAPLYNTVYNMLSPSNIYIYSLKSDYEQNFSKGRLGLGFKSSYVTSWNDFQQYYVYPNVKTKDTLHSNNFNYKENINAVYANYNRTLKGWVLQAGLRVENTNSKGISTGYREKAATYVVFDSTFDRHYVDFFPSGALTYNKDPLRQWTLNYSRRIDRPAYQDLNPFEFKIDEYTFQKGNTRLRPQYTHSVGLTFMYKYKLTSTLNYSHVQDVFTALFDTTETSKAFIIKKNLATQDIASLNISYPFQYKGYSLFFNSNSYYTLYKANFGIGRIVRVNVLATSLYVQQSIKFGKGWIAEASGFYNSPAILQGTFKAKSLWSADGGVSKSILHGAATLKASVSDIFNTLHWSAVSNFAGQTVLVAGGYESRQLKLSFSYRFGSAQVKAARQRKTGAEDENKRVSTQGGGSSQ